MIRALIIAAFAAFPAVVFAAGDIVIDPPALATEAEGLEAWGRIYKVTSHPRCSNCHTVPSDRPTWSGPHYGDKPRPHGMNICAGDSRIGAETKPCSFCHGPQNGAALHSPPGNAAGWMLAPVEAHWFG